jgi:hypothetical protein
MIYNICWTLRNEIPSLPLKAAHGTSQKWAAIIFCELLGGKIYAHFIQIRTAIKFFP